MHLEFTMKQAVIKRTVRKFAEERISPVLAEMDASGRFPSEIASEMAPLQYFGLEIPPEYGGAGLDAVSYAIVIEEVSRISGAWGSACPFITVCPRARCTTSGPSRSDEIFLSPWPRGRE
jgi:butyryl-CoA dehydrogenase